MRGAVPCYNGRVNRAWKVCLQEKRNKDKERKDKGESERKRENACCSCPCCFNLIWDYGAWWACWYYESSSRGLSIARPMLGWSLMNSPYYYFMEMGTQTNEQRLPGSAQRVLINLDAETLMGLIFQSERACVCFSPTTKVFQSDTQGPKGKETLSCSYLTSSIEFHTPLQSIPPPLQAGVHLSLLTSWEWYSHNDTSIE